MIRHFFSGLVVSITVASLGATAVGQDIDFVERFALSSDRQSTLSELVPGTESYYFFHCLHYQNTQQFDQAEQLLKTWEKRRGLTGQVQQIRHRQALLTYNDTPRDSLDYLIDKLSVRFNHQRRRPSAEPGLPTALNQSIVSFDRLNKRALGRNNLARYEDIALVVAATQTLSDSQLRNLLQRLNHPRVPDLPKLIARDLKNRDAQPFGSNTIHQLLMLEQLQELAKLSPKLRNENNYVNIYLTRLLPGHDVFWQLDTDQHLAYLQRLWEFVSELDPVHNSLKACVLFRRLDLDLTLGVYDKQRFLEYLKLPRQMSYVRESLIKDVRSNRHIANLNANYQQQTRLLPINSDEKLVRNYLHHFLVDAADYKEFESWVDDHYLRERLAEAKITAGLGDVEHWASMLTPAKYQALMKRVDLEFATTNPYIFQTDDPVKIKLTTKNVTNLIVKVFEINTANFYRNQAGEIDTDINLDGLVPNWQQTFDYDDPAVRRIERTFSFDKINHQGVFIVDFIGSGQSSRVMIRKGQLTHLVETTAAGQRFTVLDEENNILQDARLWISGTDYEPDEKGQFLVPFSNQPGRETVIIEHDGLSVRAQFDHESESYELRAGIHVDRESLLRLGTADVLIRPQLLVSGQPAPMKLLEKVRLVVRATDFDGVESTKEFSAIELAEEYETKVEILVPARLKTIQFELHGTIENVSLGQPQQLSASQSFNVNQIDATEDTSNRASSKERIRVCIVRTWQDR